MPQAIILNLAGDTIEQRGLVMHPASSQTSAYLAARSRAFSSSLRLCSAGSV
jgi:hypothetical protein